MLPNVLDGRIGSLINGVARAFAFLPLMVSFCFGELKPRTDLFLSIDAEGIEQSGISKWMGKKYPNYREWVHSNSNQTLEDFYTATELKQNDYTQLNLEIGGVRSLLDINRSADFNDTGFFLHMIAKANQSMNLEGLIQWLETKMTENFNAETVDRILEGIHLEEDLFQFRSSISDLEMPGKPAFKFRKHEGNLTLEIKVENHSTQITSTLSNDNFKYLSMGEPVAQDIGLLASFPSDRQFTFYCRLAEILNELGGPNDSSVIGQALLSIKEIGWVISFRDHSVFFSLIMACEDAAAAEALFSLWDSAIGFAKFGLMEKPSPENASALVFLNNLKSKVTGEFINFYADINRSQLDQLIASQLSLMTKVTDLKLHNKGPKSLFGMLAPSVELDLLPEGKFSLGSQRGKVVVLSYWATWSKPSRILLPILHEMEKKYSKSEVFFLVINQSEPQDQVSKFLEDYDLTELTTALDENGEIGREYLVQGLPQVVVIDPVGKVVKVWVGFSPFIEKDLSKQIDKILQD